MHWVWDDGGLATKQRSKNVGFWSGALEHRDFCQIWTDSIPNQSKKRVMHKFVSFLDIIHERAKRGVSSGKKIKSKLKYGNWVNKSWTPWHSDNNRKIPGSLGEGSITEKKVRVGANHSPAGLLDPHYVILKPNSSSVRVAAVLIVIGKWHLLLLFPKSLFPHCF